MAGLFSLHLSRSAEHTRSGLAMNTIIRMSIYAQNDDVLDEAYALLNRLDRSLSMYDPSSDISLVNSEAGLRVQVAASSGAGLRANEISSLETRVRVREEASSRAGLHVLGGDPTKSEPDMRAKGGIPSEAGQQAHKAIASEAEHQAREVFPSELEQRVQAHEVASQEAGLQACDISPSTSELPQQAHKVPPELIEALRDSLRLYELTKGIFNPLIGSVTRLWHINQADDFIPSPESLDAALKLTDISNIELTDSTIYLKEKGCVLDLGGIAKGYASRKIIDLMRDRGITSGLVDLGGNVYVLGQKDGRNWNIGIRNPLEPRGNPLAVLSVRDTSVITSGSYERYKVIDGKRYSHFFDPRTGGSVMSDLLSVTVISPDGSLADGLATAFMIAGYDESVRLLRDMNDAPGVVFVRENAKGEPEILAGKNLRDIITRSEYEVKFFE